MSATTAVPPWERAQCTLVGMGRRIATESLKPGEKLCDGCWGNRAACGGLPRADGAEP